MCLGACGAINTIPISPMAPVWDSHGLLNATCPTLPTSTLTRFSPHQDKQSMPMTDPRQTERNYGNGILGDTVSLNPSVSSPTAADCREAGVSAANLGPAFTQHNLCNCTRGCWLKLRKVQRCRHEKDNTFHPTRDWEKRSTAAIWELNCWKYLHSCLSDFETRRH